VLRGGRRGSFGFRNWGREHFDKLIVEVVVQVPHFLLLEVLAARNDIAVVISALFIIPRLYFSIREVVIVVGS
jgi:hypothetical protein